MWGSIQKRMWGSIQGRMWRSKDKCEIPFKNECEVPFKDDWVSPYEERMYRCGIEVRVESCLMTFIGFPSRRGGQVLPTSRRALSMNSTKIQTRPDVNELALPLRPGWPGQAQSFSFSSCTNMTSCEYRIPYVICDTDRLSTHFRALMYSWSTLATSLQGGGHP